MNLVDYRGAENNRVAVVSVDPLILEVVGVGKLRDLCGVGVGSILLCYSGFYVIRNFLAPVTRVW